MSRCGSLPAVVLGTLAALVTAVTAPSGARADDARPTVVLWHSYRGAEKDALDGLVADWNADPQNPVRIDTLALPNDSFPDKLEAAIPRGEGPDLFIFAHDRLGDFVAHRIVQPIELLTSEATCDRFLRPTVDALAYEDSLWGLPLDFKSVALFYNLALVPSPPATTDDLLRIARAATDPGSDRWGLVYDDEKLYFFSGWLYGFGGGLFAPSGALAIDSPPAEAALGFARTLGGPGGVVPPEMTGSKVSDLFRDGKAAMAIDGPWLLGELDGAPPYGVAPLPTISDTGQPAAPFAGVEGVLLSARARDPAAAYQVMLYLTSDASARRRATEAHQLVANVATWAEPAIAANPILAAFRAQLMRSTPMPATPAMQSIWSTYDLALEKVVSHGVAPSEALGQAERDIQHLLDVGGLGNPP